MPPSLPVPVPPVVPVTSPWRLLGYPRHRGTPGSVDEWFDSRWEQRGERRVAQGSFAEERAFPGCCEGQGRGGGGGVLQHEDLEIKINPSTFKCNRALWFFFFFCFVVLLFVFFFF